MYKGEHIGGAPDSVYAGDKIENCALSLVRAKMPGDDRELPALLVIAHSEELDRLVRSELKRTRSEGQAPLKTTQSLYEKDGQILAVVVGVQFAGCTLEADVPIPLWRAWLKLIDNSAEVRAIFSLRGNDIIDSLFRADGLKADIAAQLEKTAKSNDMLFGYANYSGSDLPLFELDEKFYSKEDIDG